MFAAAGFPAAGFAAAGAPAPLVGAVSTTIDSEPDLGLAKSYSLLAGATIANTGASTIDADVGTYPGTSITGFPPGIVTGTLHSGDSSASDAHSSLQVAYDSAAAHSATGFVEGDLGGMTFTPGTYRADAALTIGSNLIFDATGDPHAYFIISVGAALSIAAGVVITLRGGAQSSRIFWQVAGAVSMGASVQFIGSILGHAAITIGADASLVGAALTLSGAVSLSSASVEPQSPIDLGTAQSFSALAGTAVQNTGPTVLSGDVGVSPGTALVGFPPGITSGAEHENDAVATTAQADVENAYLDATARESTAQLAGDLSGQSLRAGVYTAPSTIGLATDLTLDGHGNPNGIFIFQISGRLVTSVGSRIILINGAQPSHVFWRVAGRVTLGGGSYFRGTILGLTDILVGANTNLIGRTLSHTGRVSLRTSPLSSNLPVQLGLAATFSVLSGASVANTGATEVSAEVGVSPGTASSGFPPGAISGAVHDDDSEAAQAEEDAHSAYSDAASRTPTALFAGDLGGRTLTPGVYLSTAAVTVSTSLTLDGLGNPNAIFILQVEAALNTAASSSIILLNGALASNVFWQVRGAVSLGARSHFAGNVLGQAAVSVGAGVNCVGRILALDGAVTLDSDSLTAPPLSVWYLTATISSADLSGVVIDGTSTQVGSDRTAEWVITDNRGTGAAWTLSMSATPFTSAAGSVDTIPRHLPANKLSIVPGPIAARDRPGSIIGIGSGRLDLSASSQPLAWSRGGNPGSYTFSPTFFLAVPPNAYRSNYSGAPGTSALNPYVSTLTFTID